ncbi:hypothetical protein E3N88_45947 [Mikania micrantha]|uniref:Uncharacterized protein n=1 Tax=Mikania micrantha TaxID=192012 RepID=A0A5N6L7M1_9ASTR|nr:hypothetical protein E3N88_45947 [Mikania micrantha]
MKSHIDRLERLNCRVSNELATDLILNSLSKRFESFVMNYNMNGWDKSIGELHSMLKTAEAGMGKKVLPVLTINEGGNKKRNHPDPKASVAKGKGHVKGKGKGKAKMEPTKPKEKKQKANIIVSSDLRYILGLDIHQVLYFDLVLCCSETWQYIRLSSEFCPRNELKKVETELLNHVMIGASHLAYTTRFHELATLAPGIVPKLENHTWSDVMVASGALKKEIEAARVGNSRKSDKRPDKKQKVCIEPKRNPLKSSRNQISMYPIYLYHFMYPWTSSQQLPVI